MNKYLFLGAAALVLAACSKDQISDVNRSGDEIAYDVVANNATRAEDVFCNNNKPREFTVYAVTADKKFYIQGDKIKLHGTEYTSDVKRYWPEGEVTFYSSYNAEPDVDAEHNTVTVKDFTVSSNVEEQKDFIYATKTAKKSENNGKVTFNFRHALSQVVFQAKNVGKDGAKNSTIHVEIEGVTVANHYTGGTFTFPTVSTDDNIEGHNDGKTNTDYPTIPNQGTWAQTGNGNFVVTFGAVALPQDGSVASLTAENDKKEFSSKAMLLMPQKQDAWKPTGAKGDPKEGAYFLVKTKIWNVSGKEFNKDNDVLLWGDAQTDGTVVAKEIAIPVNINWEQGKKYIYTFVFGNGNGGYNPVDDSPVLVPITYDLKIDDFVLVVDPENTVDMKTE